MASVDQALLDSMHTNIRDQVREVSKDKIGRKKAMGGVESSELAGNEETSPAAVAEVELEHGQPSGSLRVLSGAIERGWGGD